MVKLRVIKGKDLKGMKLCKVIDSDNTGCNKYRYKMGVNKDSRDLNVTDQFGSGLYFVNLKDAKSYKGFGPNLAIIEVDDDEDVVEIVEKADTKDEIISYRARKIKVTKIIKNFKQRDLKS